MKLVIAEKPSVAISIAKVIGANKKKDGYYEGNGYRVSWCVGHLIQMANPDAYDEKYAKWNMADLPIIPSDYKYEVAKATKKQFNILKKLMNNKEIDMVINACDAGREGEAIFRLVYNEAKCKKKMQRLWISSMEDSAIKEGFDNLKDGKDYDNLFESAQARAIADWLIGMNISRLYSCLYKQNYSVGRVQTPILTMIVKRDDEIAKSTRKQFNILKKLMNDKEIDAVINACDAGREGEAIFRFVYNEAKCKKKMKRLWISSMEDSAIKEGFDNLKDGKDYDNLFESAQARAIADWLVGMNISRLYSVLYQQNYSVGRVQTPTLAMIVKRDDEIANFQKDKYYIVELSMNGFTLSTDRIDDEVATEQLINLVDDKIEITDIIQKEKITKPDLPFDLTTLQRECNKYFGYSAKQTLDYAQSLYEKKLITYPRTDSRCLTEDMIVSTVNNILGKNDFDTERIKVVFDSKKVTDHHAIIPTVSSLSEDLSNISESEAKVYRLISNKLHASVGYPLIENTTKIVVLFDGFEFTSAGKVVKDDGFTKYLKDYKSKKNEDIELPDVKVGDVFEVENKEIKEKFTQPPKHFTEDTLLKAMEVAGNDALEKGAEVERKGLGTPATRAGIIENLIFKGFVERDKKNLIATHKGISLVTIVADSFKSAETTAKWEMELSDIAKGKENKEDFLKKIEEEINITIKQYK